MQLETAALTHRGYVRKTNQDAILALEEQGLFAVADGLGGERAGDEAAALVIAAVQRAGRALAQQPPAGPAELEALLRDTLEAANEDIRAHAQEPAKWGMGSTGTMLGLRRGMYCTAHVGDSRVYLVRNGALRLLTRDHTLVWMLYEQGKLERAELEHHADRHLLTQCIGTLLPIEIDAGRGMVREGDLFLICSDGLNGYVVEEKIHKLLLEDGLEVGARAEALLEEALRAGGGDNISIVLVRVAGLDATDDWRPAGASASGAGDPLAQTVDEDEPAAAGAAAGAATSAATSGTGGGAKLKLAKTTVSLGVTLAVLMLAYLLEMRFF